MRWIWWPVVLLLAGCGVQPTGLTDAGEAPTGVAPGVTLYFVDSDGRLAPQQRQTGRLGTIPEAVSLLLTGPGDSDVRTEIGPTSMIMVEVTVTEGAIELRLPLTVDDVTPLGIDQIVCTALAAHVQSGGSTATMVRTGFTQAGSESEELRSCPVIG